MNQPPKSGSHGQAGHPLSDGPFWLLLGSVVIGFAGVRLAGMFGDLWLDEIWSLGLVERIGSAREIFTELRHDNNHPLNSLWLYLLPASVPDWYYRDLT